MEQTRRRFLAASAVMGTGALAGCNAVRDAIPFIGGGGLGDYQQWVVPGDEFDQGADTVNFRAANQQAIYDNRDSLQPSTYQSLRATYRRIGVVGRDVSMDLAMPRGGSEPNRVLNGSFEVSEVTAELEDDTNTEYESDGDHDGFEIFVVSDTDQPQTAVGVSEGTIVIGHRVEPPFGADWDAVPAADVVEGIVDAGSGSGNRAVDSSEDFATLVNTLNSGTRLSGGVRDEEVGSDDGPNADAEAGQFEGEVASGQSVSINGSTTSIQWVVVFSSEGDVDTGDVNDWVEARDNSGTLARARNVEVSQNGRTAVVNAEIDTYDL